MASELTFPIRPAFEAPVRRKPSFRVRRLAAADLPQHMVGETLFEAYRAPLLQFVADWNSSPAKAATIEKALLPMKGPTFTCCLLSLRWFMRSLTGTT